MTKTIEGGLAVAESEEREAQQELTSPEKWKAYCEESFANVLHETDQETVDSHSVMWRGIDPDEVLSFLGGETHALAVHAKKLRANASSRWREAITYLGNSERPFTMAIGFLPDERRMKVGKPPEDADPDIMSEAREGHYVVDGVVEPEDARYVVVRFASGEEGKPLEPLFYSIDHKAFATRHRDRGATEAAA